MMRPTQRSAVLLAMAVAGLGAGLFAWARRPSNRIGPLIVAISFAWLATGLADTPVPALIAFGMTWRGPDRVHRPAAARLPFGPDAGPTRPPGRRPRLLCLHRPAGTRLPLRRGRLGPGTVLQIVDRHDLVLAGFWLQTVVGSAVVVATAAIVLGRMRGADPVRRRVQAPRCVYGIFALGFDPASASIVKTWFPDGALTLDVAQLAVLAAIPLAFVAGCCTAVSLAPGRSPSWAPGLPPKKAARRCRRRSAASAATPR